VCGGRVVEHAKGGLPQLAEALPLFPLFFFLELIQQLGKRLRERGLDESVVMGFERPADRVENLLIQRGAVQIRVVDWF
jgi:hypothetical protein